MLNPLRSTSSGTVGGTFSTGAGFASADVEELGGFDSSTQLAIDVHLRSTTGVWCTTEFTLDFTGVGTEAEMAEHIVQQIQFLSGAGSLGYTVVRVGTEVRVGKAAGANKGFITIATET